MTHNLHRAGSVESLRDDYVILCMPSKGINDKGSAPRIRRFLEIAQGHGTVKFADGTRGNEYTRGSLQKVFDNIHDYSVVNAVFADPDTVVKFLQTLKEANLGLSVVVTGVFEEVEKICKRAGLESHTVDYSMGQWGRTDKLPPQEMLEINTMCGHGMVSAELIQDVINDVREGNYTPEEGAELLFRPCSCGSFNPVRAARLLREIVSKGGEDKGES